MRKQREEASKIQEEIKSLRRKLEENEAKVKENRLQKEEVQQVIVDEKSNETSPMGFGCEKIVVVQRLNMKKFPKKRYLIMLLKKKRRLNTFMTR